MNLLDLTRQLNLEIVDQKTFVFKDDLYKLVRARRNEGALEYPVIAEYYFVYCPDKLIAKMLDDDEALGYFQEFQTRLLSANFFSHKNDLRWNLYLMLLVDQYGDHLDPTNVFLIENDENYARKYVVTADDAIRLINKKWLNPPANADVPHTDPVSLWHSLLEQNDLAGCLNEYAKDQMESYIEGQSINDQVWTRDGLARFPEYEDTPAEIVEIQLEQFREHCFSQQQNVNTAYVNLIHGPNGSGKTSLLESIELAFTNEIRRAKQFGEKFNKDNLVKVVCKTESNRLQEFMPGKGNAFYKQLEEKWYGIPAGRTKPTINYYFNRFNYFDSEAAFLFALEESKVEDERFDYSDNLSRLVFGDKILKYQKNWMRYLEEFQKKLTSLQKMVQEKTDIITGLRNQYHELTTNYKPEEYSINELIKEIGLKNSKWSSIGEITEIKILEELHRIIRSYEPATNYVKQYQQRLPLLSIAQLHSEQNKQKLHLEKLQLERIGRMESLNILSNEIQNIQSELTSGELSKNTVNNEINDMDRIANEWRTVLPIIRNPEKVRSRQQLVETIENLGQNAVELYQWSSRFISIFDLTAEELETLPESEFVKWVEEKNNNENALKELSLQLRQIDSIVGEVDALFINMKHLGEKYLTLVDDDPICPLCKMDHGKPDKLAEAIRSSMSIQAKGEALVIPLRQKREAVLHELSRIQEQLDRHSRNAINSDNVYKAAMELEAIGQLEIKPDVPIQQLLDQLIKKDAERQELEQLILALKRQLIALESTGVNQQTISKYELFMKENNLYARYMESDQFVKATFEEYVAAQKEKLLILLNQYDVRISDLVKRKDLLQAQIAQIDMISIDKELERAGNNLREINILFEHVKLLAEDFEIDDGENLLSFATKLEQSEVRVRLLIESINKSNRLYLVKQQLTQAESEYSELVLKCQRCKAAVDCLGQLPHLRTFTETFIKENISNIEHFFKILHMPREFDKLILDEDGLVLTRKNKKEKIKAYQMSSGQRASLALSVMFALHLAAPNAPRFIIMDEPVANMDDLHLLNLLDLLRDLALNGRQIFFTTANPDVANLFRRKFSFFDRRFKHFEFIRHADQQVRIHASYHTPDLEVDDRVDRIG